MTNIDSNQVWLFDQCKGQPWLYDVGKDQYGRYVVYANYINGEVEKCIPDRTPDGKQVLCHFAASAKATLDQFVSRPQQFMAFVQTSIEPEVVDTLEQDMELDRSVQELTDELHALEHQYDHQMLQDAFYETHDGVNAITNLSEKYHDLMDRMKTLYDRYGFDVLCEEIEG